MDRENRKLLYFSFEAGACARGHRFGRVKLPLMEIGIGEEGKLVGCLVPEYDRGKRAWEEKRLTDCLDAVIHAIPCEEYYLQPEVAGLVGVEERFPPEALLQCLLQQVPCMEYLYCIGWEEGTQRLRELLEPYFPRINHVSVVSDKPEEYEWFGEYLYMDYGTPLSCAPRLEANLGREGRTVILDGKRDYNIPWQAFPKGAVYVDIWSVEGKRQLLEKRRQDAKYLSIVKFLDTTMKSGYNTRVNYTVCRKGLRRQS